MLETLANYGFDVPSNYFSLPSDVQVAIQDSLILLREKDQAQIGWLPQTKYLFLLLFGFTKIRRV